MVHGRSSFGGSQSLSLRQVDNQNINTSRLISASSYGDGILTPRVETRASRPHQRSHDSNSHVCIFVVQKLDGFVYGEMRNPWFTES